MTEHEQTDSATSRDGLTYQEWKTALREGELLGQRCTECGRGTATAAAACPSCSSRDLEVISLPQEGTVYSETRINVAPTGFDGPYTVAIVKLAEGLFVTAHVRGDASIDDTVSLKGVLEEDTEPAPIFG